MLICKKLLQAQVVGYEQHICDSCAEYCKVCSINPLERICIATGGGIMMSNLLDVCLFQAQFFQVLQHSTDLPNAKQMLAKH